MATPPNSPRTPISTVVDAHVRGILVEAERAAFELQREVEEASMARGLELRRSAEREATRIRQQAQQEADAYLEECRRRSEAFAAGRVTRLQELSDGLLARAETIRGRLPDAEALHQSLEDLVAALTAAARTAAGEASRPSIELPRLVAEAGAGPAAPEAVGPVALDLSTAPEPSPSHQVRAVASDLPRLPRRPSKPAPQSAAPEDPPSV